MHGYDVANIMGLKESHDKTRVFSGAWYGYLTTPKYKSYLLLVWYLKTPKTHAWRQMWQATIWMNLLQCTRKTLAKLNENRHKIAQSSVQNYQCSKLYLSLAASFDFSLFSFFLYSLFIYIYIFFLYFSNGQCFKTKSNIMKTEIWHTLWELWAACLSNKDS